MSTPANPIASALGTAVAAANPLTAILGIGKDLIDRFIPDPAAKAAAQQHLLDQQVAMQEALIDQQNKVIEATSENVKNDPHMSSVRAFFCISVTCLYIWNYALCRFFHQSPIPLPTSLDAMFATIMLGFVGIPSALDTMKSIAGMPGDSSVSILGVKAANKS
jgi:hypothetical protein